MATCHVSWRQGAWSERNGHSRAESADWSDARQGGPLDAFVDVHTAGATIARRHISGVTDTQGLVVAVQLAGGVGATLGLVAGVPALLHVTCLSDHRLEWTLALARLTELIGPAIGVGRTGRLVWHTLVVGVARVARRTPARVSARRVCANGVQAALAVGSELTRALVDVVAPHLWVSSVTWRTGTREGAWLVGANGQLAALPEHPELPITLVDVLAVPVGVAREARRTVAPVGAWFVGANGSLAAQARRSVVCITLVDVHAAQFDVVRVEGEARLADTGGLFAVRLTGGVLATVDAVAGRLAAQLGVLVDGNEAVVAGTLEGSLGVETFAVLSARV